MSNPRTLGDGSWDENQTRRGEALKRRKGEVRALNAGQHPELRGLQHRPTESNHFRNIRTSGTSVVGAPTEREGEKNNSEGITLAVSNKSGWEPKGGCLYLCGNGQ